MEWINREFLTGFQMLATLGLEGQPAAEVIPITVQVWLKAICRNRVFDQVQDAPRIREAFALLAERSRRWPAPADFLSSLPDRQKPKAVPRIESDAKRESNAAKLREIVANLDGFRSTRDGGDAA